MELSRGGNYGSGTAKYSAGSIWVYADYSVPKDSVHVEFKIYEGSSHKLLLQKVVAFETDSFLKNAGISQENSGARAKVINAYYGAGNGYNTQVMDALAESDTIARMWKAYFTNQGIAGYNKDAELSLILAGEAANAVEAEARKGNPECLFLYNQNLPRKTTNKFQHLSANYLLKVAADQNYPIAMLEYGRSLLSQDKGQDALNMLNKAYSKNILKAAIPTAFIYEQGIGVPRNPAKAKDLYQSLINKGDGEATVWLARSYFKSGNEDVQKGINLLTAAEKLGELQSMTELAVYYLDNRDKNNGYIDEAISILTKAAAKGSVDAGFLLGSIYVSDRISLKHKDVAKGLPYIKSAAEFGHPASMLLVGLAYQEGNTVERNVYKARYWINKAYLNGAGTGNEALTVDNPFFNFIGDLDFSPRRKVTVVDSYTGNEIRSYLEGPNAFELFGEAWQTAWQNSRVQTQAILDGVEFIQTRKGVDIYGGVVSSEKASSLKVTQGQRLEIAAFGKIQFGNLAGTRYPTGERTSSLGEGLIKDLVRDDFARYSIVPRFKHGCFIIKIGDSDWFYVGSKKIISVPESGEVILAVNDKDYVGNKGYFDIEIKVYNDN